MDKSEKKNQCTEVRVPATQAKTLIFFQNKTTGMASNIDPSLHAK